MIAIHQVLIRQALSEWGQQRLYLSLDTTLVWNCFCIVWVGVVYRGRTVPIARQGLWTIQRALRQVTRVLPVDAMIVLLADRGKASGQLMKYLQQNLGWHFRIRIKRSFAFQLHGEWRKVSEVHLPSGQAYFTPAVSIGKTKPYAGVSLAFAHDQPSGEN